MCRLPLCTPNVKPTMSGVIVERRDQVRITCGRCPPERTRSTILRIPLSIQGPFLTERGMVYFRLPIANRRFENAFWLTSQSAIGNQKSAILFNSPISHDHFLRALVVTFLVTTSQLSQVR